MAVDQRMGQVTHLSVPGDIGGALAARACALDMG